MNIFKTLEFKNPKGKLLGNVYAHPIEVKKGKYDWAGCETPLLMRKETTIRKLKQLYKGLDFDCVKLVSKRLLESRLNSFPTKGEVDKQARIATSEIQHPDDRMYARNGFIACAKWLQSRQGVEGELKRFLVWAMANDQVEIDKTHWLPGSVNTDEDAIMQLIYLYQEDTRIEHQEPQQEEGKEQ